MSTLTGVTFVRWCMQVITNHSTNMISELSVGALGGAKDAAIAWALRSGGRLERGGVLRLDRGFPDAWQLESLRNITCIMPQNMDSDGPQFMCPDTEVLVLVRGMPPRRLTRASGTPWWARSVLLCWRLRSELLPLLGQWHLMMQKHQVLLQRLPLHQDQVLQ